MHTTAATATPTAPSFLLPMPQGQLLTMSRHGPILPLPGPLRSPFPLLPFAAPPLPPPPPASLRGVRAQSGKWQARIKINGKVKSLGTYIDRRTAGLAYDRAALRHQGTKAQLNFPSVSLRASLEEGARRGNSTGEHERHHRGDHQHDTDGNTTRTSPLALLRAPVSSSFFPPSYHPCHHQILFPLVSLFLIFILVFIIYNI